MLLADLILELRELLVDPRANFEVIIDRLAAHDDLAEYEVARQYVVPAIEGLIRERLDDPDPQVRVQAIVAVRQCFSRSAAAKLLRHLVKDANLSVRGAAREAVSSLGFDEVALPNADFNPRHQRWNLGGWYFGTGDWRRPGLAPQAVRAALPSLPDVAALASWLNIDDPAELRRFMRPGSDTGSPYIDFEIPKAKGGVRVISAPRAPLRAIQRKIYAELLAAIANHDAAHGFIAGRSTVSNAAPHVGARLVLKTDIREFFPTVHYWRVRGLFRWLGLGSVAGELAALCTRRPVVERNGQRMVVWPGVLPQGAPTSPAIANLVCRRLDARLQGLAERLDARYTRYADDLTFSFHGSDGGGEPGVAVGRVFWWIDQILQQEGFAEHAGKRQVLRPGGRQLVTGIVVNERQSVPRPVRRRFRAILHNCKRDGLASQAHGRDDFADYLRGFAAYVQMVQPQLGQRWVAEVEALLAGR
ncbi:RNA-directed DNA polymerase [Pseudenhygromyxa sp. WMMC2535]|uniref:reverse transcriptase domain-containing protein n=1 Tax=Pseudenhygromyxa sp. WMMC2535 TaxID=2712867 RepID=UPI001554B769|nr:reverse transcriptase domain-containing protein [Pseudenhygromyxa sp. WMMC2535]NVB41737.1 RNA-directed DNA polymerase [Pseudenhygromyxa sp. WMMC2535]